MGRMNYNSYYEEISNYKIRKGFVIMHENLKENEEAMKALAEFANACCDKGCKDTLVGVVAGACLAIAGYAAMALYQGFKKQLKANG